MTIRTHLRLTCRPRRGRECTWILRKCCFWLLRFKWCDIILWSLPSKCANHVNRNWFHTGFIKVMTILMSVFHWLAQEKWYGKPLSTSFVATKSCNRLQTSKLYKNCEYWPEIRLFPNFSEVQVEKLALISYDLRISSTVIGLKNITLGLTRCLEDFLSYSLTFTLLSYVGILNIRK